MEPKEITEKRRKIETQITNWLLDGSITLKQVEWHLRYNQCDSVEKLPEYRLESFFDALRRDRKKRG